MKDEVFVVLVRDENGGEAFVKDTLIDAIKSFVENLEVFFELIRIKRLKTT